CICLEVLEHLENDARALREINRVLRAKGTFVAAVPYTHYWPEYKQLMGHYRHYSKDSFTSVLAESGFRVLKYLPNYPRWHQRFSRSFALIRACATLFGHFSSRSPYQFRWPWRNENEIARLESRLAPLRASDAQLEYSRLQTSTFVVAEKF